MTEPFTPKPKKKRKPRETGRTGTEASGRKAVKASGGESFKWRSPGRNGVPDQIEIYGVEAMMDTAALFGYLMTPEEAGAILAAAIRFTEYKAPGKLKATTINQRSMHTLLRERGFTVDVVDTFRSKVK